MRTPRVNARVIDLYFVKQTDATLCEAVEATYGGSSRWTTGRRSRDRRCWARAGEELTFATLAVREMPASGERAELLAATGSDADRVSATGRRLVSAGVSA